MNATADVHIISVWWRIAVTWLRGLKKKKAKTLVSELFFLGFILEREHVCVGRVGAEGKEERILSRLCTEHGHGAQSHTLKIMTWAKTESDGQPTKPPRLPKTSYVLFNKTANKPTSMVSFIMDGNYHSSATFIQYHRNCWVYSLNDPNFIPLSI